MRLAVSALGLALALLPVPALAGLAGSTVGEGYYFPDAATLYAGASYTPQSFVVGAGPESVIDVEGVTTITVDFADTSLDLFFDTVLTNPVWNAAAFNGVIFTGPGFASLNSVTVNPSTNFAGFDASRVTLSGNELRLNWQGLGYDDGTTVSLSFGVVPEPETWALLIAGFGMVGLAARRRGTPRVAA